MQLTPFKCVTFFIAIIVGFENCSVNVTQSASLTLIDTCVRVKRWNRNHNSIFLSIKSQDGLASND